MDKQYLNYYEQLELLKELERKNLILREVAAKHQDIIVTEMRQIIQSKITLSEGMEGVFPPWRESQTKHIEKPFTPVEVFYSFAGEDISLLEQLENHLSGASGKFRLLLEAEQCQAFCEADGVGDDPTRRDACGHSSRLLPSLRPPRLLARSRTVGL